MPRRVRLSRRDGRLRLTRRVRRGLAAFAGIAAVGAVVASLPRRLPSRVVALRMWLFARINGEETIVIPGPQVGVERFKQVYAHPAANGRSRGAALSDLFWYWLAPGPEIHQEHLEPGARYDEVAQATRRILSMPAGRVEELASRHAAGALAAADGARTVRLRDLVMPVWAGFFAEVVFGPEYPLDTPRLAVGHADDVVTALKCCGLRHMERRHRLTRFLRQNLDRVPHALPAGLTPHEQALYLQGTFFNTAVVQMSEATAHVLMVLAHHPTLQDSLTDPAGDGPLLDHVMDETLRLYPLFGIAHRITSDAIAVDDRTTLPAGSVLCFNYPDFHRHGFDDPERFDPGRWERLSAKEANYIPFGVAANRPCPAWHLAPIALRAVVGEVLTRFALHSSAEHTRSLPNRGPCLLVPRGAEPSRLTSRLTWMRTRDRWENVGRSVVQLVLGTYMVWDARRQRLCERHFAANPPTLAPRPTTPPPPPMAAAAKPPKLASQEPESGASGANYGELRSRHPHELGTTDR